MPRPCRLHHGYIRGNEVCRIVSVRAFPAKRRKVDLRESTDSRRIRRALQRREREREKERENSKQLIDGQIGRELHRSSIFLPSRA